MRRLYEQCRPPAPEANQPLIFEPFWFTSGRKNLPWILTRQLAQKLRASDNQADLQGKAVQRSSSMEVLPSSSMAVNFPGEVRIDVQL